MVKVGDISMIYCEGKYCSRRNQCAYHEIFDWEYPRQYLDESTQGCGSEGIDENGNCFSHHEVFCGDRSKHYNLYKAIGWREGNEYRNSIGLKYAEECVKCEHRQLCFYLLEYAGMITYEGRRIMNHMCEDIVAHSDEYKNKVEEWLGRSI